MRLAQDLHIRIQRLFEECSGFLERSLRMEARCDTILEPGDCGALHVHEFQCLKSRQEVRGIRAQDSKSSRKIDFLCPRRTSLHKTVLGVFSLLCRTLAGAELSNQPVHPHTFMA